jgi:preprotein translocase subunit SecB
VQESTFKFIGYRVPNIECHINDAFGDEPEELRQVVKVGQKFDKNNKRSVEIILKVSVESKSGNLKFNLEMKGGFKGTDSMTDATFENLCHINAPAILFPYARSIIASYTALANIPAITLPITDFTAHLKKNKKKATKTPK